MTTANQVPVIAPPQHLWAAPRAWARAFVGRFIGQGPQAKPVDSAVALNQRATHWVATPLGRRVTCESGLLWLSFDGEPQDIVLEPGQTHRCAQRSALAIHALVPSVARLA